MSRSFRTLHKTCGIIAAVAVLWMAASGLLLQLSASLHWDRAALPDWLAQPIYASAGAPAHIVAARGHDLRDSARGWLFDGQLVEHPPGRPRALLSVGDLLLALGDQGAIVFTDSGELVERLLPAAIGLRAPQASLVTDRRLCLRESATQVVCSQDGGSWQRQDGGVRSIADSGAADWQALPPAAADGQRPAAPTWERLIQDLHALRFLGPLAPLVGVLVAVTLCLLAITGTWTYLQHRRRWGRARPVHRRPGHH